MPWISSHLEEVMVLMGWDFYPYGVEPNRKTLETFLRYCHEQGLARKQLKPEDIFVKETREQFKV